ncbi:MAG: hypothetical protein ACKV0T_22775, partial [Planctomycetales bacterium]
MKPKATKEQLDLLKEQSFSAETPGTILADFETLLEFIGVEGLASSGKYCRLPLSALSAIDERMRHPLRPNLERPQQLSFPHLNGLYMLLRCTALGITKGAGSRARICIDPALWEEWRSLQPVEQYVALLKFVMYPDWSVVDGSRGSSWESWHNWQ